MKNLCAILSLVLCSQFVLTNYNHAQSKNPISNPLLPYHTLKSMSLGVNNFRSTQKQALVDISKQKKYVDDAIVDKYAASDRVVEVYERRTRDSKEYVDKDTLSKHYLVKSNEALHYWKDKQWLTIDERLDAKDNGVFEASRQEEPVGFDVNKQNAYIKTLQGKVCFNNWFLYGMLNGKEVLLAKANWSNYTIGDEGIYITNIFAGMDAEMKVGRGVIKTSFIIRKYVYSEVQQLIFKDVFEGGENASFISNNAVNEVDFMVHNIKSLHISKPIAYQENDPANSFQELSYELSNDTLSISIDNNYVKTKLLNGHLVIDPLVSTSNSLAQSSITGSMDCGSGLNACNYLLQVPSPPKATITDVFFQFGFNTVGSALNKNGFFVIKSGACNVYLSADPNNTTAYNSPGTTSTFGEYDNISYYMMACMPPPSCASVNIPFLLGFYNNICTGPSVCSENNIKANEPFIIMIEGRTLELDSISSPISICLGESATLSALGKYGVPPYTYTWDNSAGNGQSVTVNPVITTNYRVTITDQCNNTVTGTVEVTVKQPTVSSTTASICQGQNYFMNGIPYTATGIYTANLSNIAGCDSTATLHLSVLQPKQTAISDEICRGETLYFGNQSLTETGLYTNIFSTSYACDSSVTLTLTVKPTYSLNRSINILYGESDTINGIIFDREGLYHSVYTANNGCDSTIVTKISIVRSLCPKIIVPKYISPNGDGVNDFFEIENISCYLKSTVFILDRYGKIVTNYSGLDLGWDGTYLGKPAPSTDYWYEIVLPETGERIVGHFLLKR